MYAPTPQRVINAANARIAAELESGYGVTQDPRARRKVRGALLCRNPACFNGFVHRDTDAAKLILLHALAKDQGWAGVACMLKIRHHDKPVRRFEIYGEI